MANITTMLSSSAVVYRGSLNLYAFSNQASFVSLACKTALVAGATFANSLHVVPVIVPLTVSLVVVASTAIFLNHLLLNASHFHRTSVRFPSLSDRVIPIHYYNSFFVPTYHPSVFGPSTNRPNPINLHYCRRDIVGERAIRFAPLQAPFNHFPIRRDIVGARR